MVKLKVLLTVLNYEEITFFLEKEMDCFLEKSKFTYIPTYYHFCLTREDYDMIKKKYPKIIFIEEI